MRTKASPVLCRFPIRLGRLPSVPGPFCFLKPRPCHVQHGDLFVLVVAFDCQQDAFDGAMQVLLYPMATPINALVNCATGRPKFRQTSTASLPEISRQRVATPLSELRTFAANELFGLLRDQCRISQSRAARWAAAISFCDISAAIS